MDGDAGSASMDGTTGQLTTASVRAVVHSTTVKPGESSYVTVMVEHPTVGTRDARVEVHSNDSAEPEQTLTLSFEVVR
jgi:hypothetical protein